MDPKQSQKHWCCCLQGRKSPLSQNNQTFLDISLSFQKSFKVKIVETDEDKMLNLFEIALSSTL